MYKYLIGFIAKIYFPLILFCVIEFALVDFLLENPLSTYIDMSLMALTLINLFVIIVEFNSLSRFLQVLVVFMFLLLFYLVIKSYATYQTPFVYPNVFKKALIPLGIPAMFIISKRTGKFSFKYLINWIYAALALKIIVTFAMGLQPGFIWGPDTRLTFAKEAGFLLLPMLYHLNQYCLGKAKPYMALMDLFLIFIAQHRTVWIAAFIGVILILAKYPNTIRKIVPTASVLVLLVVFFLSLNLFEISFLETLQTQVEDIFDYKNRGTGAWRYEQSQFFLSRIEEKPVMGWDFEAFEKGEVMEVESFGDMGTHIHSAYIDPLYYFGTFGLILAWIGFLVLGLKYFSMKKSELLVYPILAICWFSFGTSYQLPLAAYFFCGIGLATVENYSARYRVSLPQYQGA